MAGAKLCKGFCVEGFLEKLRGKGQKRSGGKTESGWRDYNRGVFRRKRGAAKDLPGDGWETL